MHKMLRQISLLLFSVALLMGCAKQNDPFAGYPRDAKITYKVSSTDPGGVADIEFTNDTGGETELKGVKLPFTQSISKRVEFAEIVSIGASVSNVNSITVAIEVDGKVAESARFDSANRVFGYASYQFD